MVQNKSVENIIIIGGGPAGLSAALYAARAELSPLVLSGIELGGQAALTERIENYPGFPMGISGAELMELFQENAERFGARVQLETVSSVDFSIRPFYINTQEKQYFAHSVVISTGADPRKLNIPGETELCGRGVSYCATCDGRFFKDKKIAVIGGGDSALEESLLLTRFASSVTVVHRRAELRASAILQKRARENKKIQFVWNSIVESINGAEAVNSISIKNILNGNQTTLPMDGVFIFIGHSPNSDIFKEYLKRDEKGYLKVDRHLQTSLPGVFAAGEVADNFYRQVIISAGMGAAAAIEATYYLQNLEL